MATSDQSGLMGFLLSESDYQAPGLRSVYGPREDPPNSGVVRFFSTVVLAIKSNASLRAPWDCWATVVTDEGGVQYVALRGSLVPQNGVEPLLLRLTRRQLLSEVPRFIVIPLDEITFFGTDDVAGGVLLSSLVSDPQRKALFGERTAAELAERVRNGRTSIPLDRGTEFGRTRGDSLTMSVVTSPRIERSLMLQPIGTPATREWADVSRRNSMDPAIFWQTLLKAEREDGGSVFASSEDLAAAAKWFDPPAPGGYRIVVELRDEHNRLLDPTSDKAGRLRIRATPPIIQTASGPKGEVLAAEVPHSRVFVLQSPVSLTLESVRSVTDGPVVPAVDEQMVFSVATPGARQSFVDRSTDVDVTAPAHVVVHVLRPADWLAPQQAVVAQGWRPLLRYTTGNRVTPLIDGPEYFSRLVRDIRSVDPDNDDHFLHIAGWHLEDQFDLTVAGTSLESLMLERGTSGVRPRGYRTRVLKFDQLGFMEFLFPETDAIDRLKGVQADAFLDKEGLSEEVVIDVGGIQVEWRYTAHHMKIVTIRGTGGLVAYCGGMDVVSDRLTDPRHDQAKGYARAIHDVQMEVAGPAAVELEQVFWMRWNTKTKDVTGYPELDGPTRTALGAAVGPIIVQVANTVPAPEGGFLNKMATSGDRTLLATLERALGNARQYIYIEDQYFKSPRIGKLLRNKLSDVEFIVVVLPRLLPPNETFDYSYLDDDVKPALAGIMRKILQDDFVYETGEHRSSVPVDDVKRRLRICCLEAGEPFHSYEPVWDRLDWDPNLLPGQVESPMVYVHAKLAIVDDVFISCGAANLDARGLGTPSGKASTETNLMVIDERVTPEGSRRLARDLRIRLWAEHLGLPIPADRVVANSPVFAKLEDPVEAYRRFWWLDPSSGGSRIRIHPEWEKLL